MSAEAFGGGARHTPRTYPYVKSNTEVHTLQHG